MLLIKFSAWILVLVSYFRMAFVGQTLSAKWKICERQCLPLGSHYTYRIWIAMEMFPPPFPISLRSGILHFLSNISNISVIREPCKITTIFIVALLECIRHPRQPNIHPIQFSNTHTHTDTYLSNTQFSRLSCCVVGTIFAGFCYNWKSI